jgi:hypothetical protein
MKKRSDEDLLDSLVGDVVKLKFWLEKNNITIPESISKHLEKNLIEAKDRTDE